MLLDLYWAAGLLAAMSLFGLVFGDYQLALVASAIGLCAYYLSEQLRRL